MKKRNLTLFTAIAAAAAFASTAQASLIIYVVENTVTGKVDFSWNGIIGASDTAGTPPAGNPSADQIEPSTGQIQLGDRTTNDLNSGAKFTASGVYAGSSFAYGSGSNGGDGFSEFLTTQNIPFRVIPNTGTGDLLVGYTDQANTTGIPDLATTVFTGSFSLPGDFADYGLFDTGPTALPTAVWTATTGTGSISLAAILEPSTGPAITSKNPDDEATDVTIDANLVATFDEDIALTGGGTITISDLGAGPDVVITLPDDQVSVSGAVLTINPTDNLLPDNSYAVRISDDAVEDLATNANAFAGILNDTTWNFDTADAVTGPDDTDPAITSKNPDDAATDVAIDANLVATFDENIALTGGGTITISDLGAGPDVVIDLSDHGGQVTVSGAVLTINPTADLLPGNSYAVRISADAVEDLATTPFAGILNDTAWNFDTAVAENLRISVTNGWKAFEVITVGDNPSGSYAMPGTFDGIGAQIVGSELRVQINHELSNVGTISEVNLNLANFKTSVDNMVTSGSTGGGSFVNSAQQAYDRWSDDGGSSWTDTTNTSNTSFDRFCSGQSYNANTFGANRGFVDSMYITGEEFGGTGNDRLFAIDLATRDMYQLSGVSGSAAGGIGGMPFDSWENAALLDTGETNHVALLLSPDGGTKTMQIYIGEKGKDETGIADSTSFLARNGLAYGSYYYLFDSLPTIGSPSTDGTFDTTLTTGSLTSSKFEDVDTSLADPTKAVLGNQNSGLFTFDFNLDFSGGSFVAGTSGFSITKLQNDNASGSNSFNNPDNVDWTDATTLNGTTYADGLIFVNEDSSEGEIWMMEPDGTGLVKIGQTLDDTESTGIVDISDLVGYNAGSVLLSNNQGSNSSLSVLINPNATTQATSDTDAGVTVVDIGVIGHSDIRGTSDWNTSLTLDASGNAYAVFVDSNFKNTVAKVTPDGVVTTQIIDTTNNELDAHNTPSIAIDGDGFLHVAYNMHHHPMRMRKSPTAYSVAGDWTDEGGSEGAWADDGDTRFTYPAMSTAPNGDVYMTVRNSGTTTTGGLAANLFHYDTSEGTWNDRGDFAQKDGYWAYLPAPYVALDGKVHLEWHWLNRALAQGKRQLGSYVVYDPDPEPGDPIWSKADGTEYTIPITPETADLYQPSEAPWGEPGISDTSLTVNAIGQPILAYNFFHDGDNDQRVIRLARWDGSEWQHQDLDGPVTGTTIGDPVIVNRDGTLHIYYKDFEGKMTLRSSVDNGLTFGDAITLTAEAVTAPHVLIGTSIGDNQEAIFFMDENYATKMMFVDYAQVADTDGDELPDLWEDEHFGNDDGTPTPGELAESDGSGDFDGDGTSDLDEFRLGLIPTDPNSTFKLDISPGGAAGTVELSWPSQEGLQFEIYFTDDLSLPRENWSVISPITDDDGDGAPTHEWIDEDITSSPRRFYRVSLLP